MDITKFKGVGSQMVMYKELRSSKIRYKYTEPEPPTPGVVKHFYWTVDSIMPVNENLSTDRIYSFTLSANTKKGSSLFGTADKNDSNDFRIFWYELDHWLFFDSGSERLYYNNFGCLYTDILTYDLTYNSLKVFKNNEQKKYYSLSGNVKTSGDLYFVSINGTNKESLNLYEFKVYDTNNNLLKHYIPLEDGRTLYDIVSKTTFDVGKTFTATETDVTVNEKGEEIPGYEYKN